VGVRVERTLRPYCGESHGVQSFDRPLLRVVGQFDNLIFDGLAEANTDPSTRAIGLPEHHPPLVALGAIILRSPRFEARLHPAGIAEIVDNWCEGGLKFGMHAPIMTQRQGTARSAVASGWRTSP
jgi:hypothetical protein